MKVVKDQRAAGAATGQSAGALRCVLLGALLIAGASICSHEARAQVSFGAATNFLVGTRPFSVTSADFNGDGKLDLATANYFSDTVSVLLGDGSGGFGAATNFLVGTNPASVKIADFNGDGKLDLAVANFGSKNVSVLLGDGSGSFGAATNFLVGTNPFTVTSADFNGDGKLDLAAANFGSSNVSVLLGDGSGGFGAATNFVVGSNPIPVTSADFNGDGKLDLAVANFGSNNVSVLLNTTNFAPRLSATALTVAEGGSGTLAASDSEGNTISATFPTPPTNGSATFNATTNVLTYTHNGGETSSDTFSVTLSDGTSSRTFIVTVTVTPVNDAPVVTLPGAAVTYSEGDGPLLVDVAASVSDVDSANFDTGTLTVGFTSAANADDRLDFSNQGSGAGQIGVTSTTVSVGGVVIGTRSGGAGTTPLVVTFNTNATPAAVQALLLRLDFASVSDTPPTASRTLSIVLSDGDGGTSAPVTRAVSINAVNDAPTISAIAPQSTNEDTSTAAIAFSIGDVDSPLSSLTVSTTSSNTSLVPNANIVLGGSGANGNVTITPAPNQNGTATITLTVSDGTATGTTTFSLQVLAVNDAPLAVDDNYNVVGGSLWVPARGVLSNDSDIEGDELMAVLEANVKNGTLILNANGSFTYTAQAGFNGTDSFTYRSNDGKLNSAVATVTLTNSNNLARTLSLSVPQSTLREGDTLQATLTLSRATTETVTVQLASSDTATTTVPAAVTVAAGQTSATFDIRGVSDRVAGGSRSVRISASSRDYGTTSLDITVTNADVPTPAPTPEIPTLTLTVAPSTFIENGGPTAALATLTRNVVPAQRLTVKLTSTDAGEARVPQEVVIPSGARSTRFWVEAVDDRVADGAQDANLVARADGFVAGVAPVRVEDNGRVTQALSLTLNNTSGVFSEGTVGDQRGSVSIPTALTRDAIITLSSSDSSLVGVPRAVRLRAGQKSAGFVFRVQDNKEAQGTQRVVLTAKLLGVATAVKEVQVLDNDEPTLTLTLSSSSVSENAGSIMGTLVMRNTPTSSGMLIKLTNSDPARVSTPFEVWIPSGRDITSFPISIVDNNLADGSHSITLTVSRDGFRSGTATLQVLDNDSRS